MRVIHYFSPMSGFAYLGVAELCAVAKRHGAEVDHRPVDIARVFAAIDTIAPARQAPARLAWRRKDMARWARDEDIASESTLTALAKACGLDAVKLLSDASSDAMAAAYDANTQDAIAHGVIGSPTMRIAEENFFGQDRLDFVEAELVRINLA